MKPSYYKKEGSSTKRGMKNKKEREKITKSCTVEKRVIQRIIYPQPNRGRLWIRIFAFIFYHSSVKLHWKSFLSLTITKQSLRIKGLTLITHLYKLVAMSLLNNPSLFGLGLILILSRIEKIHKSYLEGLFIYLFFF